MSLGHSEQKSRARATFNFLPRHNPAQYYSMHKLYKKKKISEDPTSLECTNKELLAVFSHAKLASGFSISRFPSSFINVPDIHWAVIPSG